MEYFKETSLSSSRRPELLPDESILIQQGHVGLYKGKEKLNHYQDGICYLTSHRIIYVDNTHPLEYSVELSLSLIKDIENYSGFLRSSPKIIIDVNESQPVETNNTTWACSICFFSNKATADTCELCGVRNEHVDKVVPVQAHVDDSSTCTICTFQNHPSMVQCEMCGSDLPRAITTYTHGPGQVRLSFRHGGQAAFLNKLKQALQVKQWEKAKNTPTTPTAVRGVGINAIEDRIKKTTLETNETMTDAFQDLDRLMTKATEMVKLAESISNKVSKDQDNELSTLRTHLLALGIASPVTKGSAGSIYHQELAKELADFLSKFFDRDDMKSLTDIYCLFNRARGVALISPEDLYKASQQFEALKLPFRLRQFSSGLLVIQSIDMDDTRAASRILKHVKNQGVLTAIRLAEIEDLALAVATEQLIVTERMGLICRDEGPTGLSYYENLFVL
ncbi:EAP30/Vps36 family-domain-containing protein [Gilbertella persicaria]|uniref:EAP30/Vps36 family-domain-containing protein n=1 Tax=Gilbertella persicaria TaxID=101096 RepID=UPI002220CBA5|nr:EAP30/Vps36 family-domain-containing protein [Gilbertella persicaria]KAI8047360.1 EAP30/Vps36 family-domain-containing protein [Gilbertella persicaria]